MQFPATDLTGVRVHAQAWADHAESLTDFAFARFIHRRDVFGIYLPDGSTATAHEAVTANLLHNHFLGVRTIGAHVITNDDQCKVIMGDVDAHTDNDDPDANWRCALRMGELYAEVGLTVLIEDSNGRGGFHPWAFFKKPVPSKVAYWFCKRVQATLVAEGFKAPEMFPKQARLRMETPYGNWPRLPGKHHKREHWSRFWCPKRQVWLPGASAVERLLKVAGDDTKQLLSAYKAATATEEKAEEKPSPFDDMVVTTIKSGNKRAHAGYGQRSNNGSQEKPSAAKIRSALERVPSNWATDYDIWLNVGMACEHWDSNEGLEVWKEFSQRSPDQYDAGVCESKWATFSSSGSNCFTVLSIFRAAWDNGWDGYQVEPPPKAKASTNGTGHHHNGSANGTGHKGTSNGDGQHKPDPPPEPEVEQDDYEAATEIELGITDAIDVEEENPVWLWEGRFLRGKINLLGGEGGDGKTTVAIMVGAIKINGGNFPDGSPSGPPGRVAILAAEDGAADTLKPRFIAAGANLEEGRLKFLQARVAIPKKGNRPALVHPTSLQDIPYWRAVFTKLQLDILIIDPLPAYLGRGVNDHKNSEVQAALNQFAALANEFNVCVIAITHTGKAKDVKLVHKILGSVAYTNCARVVHVTARDPDDETIRYLARPKCNLDEPRDPLVYRLEGFSYQKGDKTFKTSRVVFEKDPVKIDLDAIATGKGSARGPTPEKTMAVAEWLYDWLAKEAGAAPLGCIMNDAGLAGLIGKQKDGKWSNPKILYDAKDRVCELPSPRDKKRVTDFKVERQAGGKKIVHWELVDGAAQTYESMFAQHDAKQQAKDDFDPDRPF